MIGEIAIGGVLLPALLVLAVVALAITVMLSRLLQLAGAYRLVAYRALVDVTLFVFVLGLLVVVTSPLGLPA